MKKLILFSMIGLTAISCGSRPEPESFFPDFPKAQGDYSRVETNCASVFDINISVEQDGQIIDLVSESANFLDLEGVIESNGSFSVENSETSCVGQLSRGFLTAKCIIGERACDVKYERD